MEHPGTRQVGEQHTERDREQQERLVFLMNGEIQQEEGHQQHDTLLPRHLHESHALKKFQNIHNL